MTKAKALIGKRVIGALNGAKGTVIDARAVKAPKGWPHKFTGIDCLVRWDKIQHWISDFASDLEDSWEDAGDLELEESTIDLSKPTRTERVRGFQPPWRTVFVYHCQHGHEVRVRASSFRGKTPVPSTGAITCPVCKI
jgi:hypothetical protein